VSFGGKKAWVVRYRVHGRLRRLTLGTYPVIGLADARQRAKLAMLEVSSGSDPAVEKRAARTAETFGNLAEECLERHAKIKKRSWKEDERILNAELLPHWKHTPLRDLKRREVRNLVHAIAARPAPIMANRTLALVRKMLNFAIESEWMEANPASLIPKPGAEQSRDRVLTRNEIKAFWVAVEEEPPAIRAWLRLRLLTVQRGGEVVRMRWRDVDLQNKWWTIPAENEEQADPSRPAERDGRDVAARAPVIRNTGTDLGVRQLQSRRAGGSRCQEGDRSRETPDERRFPRPRPSPNGGQHHGVLGREPARHRQSAEPC
jgi:integrase